MRRVAKTLKIDKHLRLHVKVSASESVHSVVVEKGGLKDVFKPFVMLFFPFHLFCVLGASDAGFVFF